MNYYETHQKHLYRCEEERKKWLWGYFKDNFYPLVKNFPSSFRILELGCSTGHLLNYLHYIGFRNLTGCDIDSTSLDIAKKDGLYGIEYIEGDAIDILQNQKADVIISRCMVPHLSKETIIPFVELMRKALNPHGRIIMLVGNMAHLIATQDRYVDFTHDAGFTKESLSQVLRLAGFSSVRVYPSKDDGHKNIKRRCAQWLVGNLLQAAHHSIDKDLIWSRDLIAVATK